jgi:hypothetical protein
MTLAHAVKGIATQTDIYILMPYICTSCANGDITSVSLDSNGLKGTIPLSLGSLTGFNYMDLALNNLHGHHPVVELGISDQGHHLHSR